MALPVFMGGLSTKLSLRQGSSDFSAVSATIVAKPTGTNNRLTVVSIPKQGSVVPTLNSKGDTVYQQDYYVNFDTTSPLSASSSWDLGYEVTAPGSVTTNWFGSYVNGNLTNNIGAFTIYAQFGTSTYRGSSSGSTFGWDTQPVPPFKGQVIFYISENWNPAVTDPGAALAAAQIRYNIDVGAYTISTATDFIQITDPITGRPDVARRIGTFDTTFWTNGNHTINWEVSRTYPGASDFGGYIKYGIITFATDQTVAGGTISTYNIGLYGALPNDFDRHYPSVPVEWLFKVNSVNQYTGAMSYSVAGLPAGSTGIFTPSTGSLLPGGSITTTLTVSAPSAYIGSYPLTIHATSGSYDQTTNVILSVIDSTPGGGGGRGCVPAGTPLFTADGWVMIEDVTIGQPVLAFDEETLTQVEATVSDVLVYPDRELYRVETHDGDIICSHDHRLTLVSSRGGIAYVPARNLMAGDNVMTHDGTETRVSRIFCVESTRETTTVYHVTLTGGHVFVAGGFLAHNLKVPLLEAL